MLEQYHPALPASVFPSIMTAVANLAGPSTSKQLLPSRIAGSFSLRHDRGDPIQQMDFHELVVLLYVQFCMVQVWPFPDENKLYRTINICGEKWRCFPETLPTLFTCCTKNRYLRGSFDWKGRRQQKTKEKNRQSPTSCLWSTRKHVHARPSNTVIGKTG